MKTILDKNTRYEVIARINSLNESSVAQWGKMNVYQMLKHCAMWEEMLLGKIQHKQSFIGKIFGKIALKDMMKDEPVKRGLPTVPSFKMTGNGDVEAAKADWITLLNEHDGHENQGFMHPFFGQITAEQAGIMAYKHTDHHLRQFGV